MEPVGSLLWRSLRVWQIYGANTEVGKTVLTTILCKAARARYKDDLTAYLKPVSTGPEDEADSRHLNKYAKGVSHATLHQYDLAISPHAAARDKFIPSDKSLLASIYAHATQTAARGFGWLFIETAGGVHSPGPSGTPQAELYKPLRCPVVLIGDSKLGGISLTISAYESLKIRGYDIEAIVLFHEDHYKNWEYLTEYFKEHHGIPVYSLPPPPPRETRSEHTDEQMMTDYYSGNSQAPATYSILQHLDEKHKTRVSRLESMAASAHSKIWYPFTQQKLLSPSSITAIDSANADFFQALIPQPPSYSPETEGTPLLQPSFDGSASWWTQGLGHGSTSLTLAASYAAGRYGHVMFAEAIHEPALALAETLISGMQNPRLKRVFYSDDGSTGVEVAVKMGLRAARVRYGWSVNEKLGIIGLKGGYHGDTIGAMDCAEPCAYNEKVEWYEGKGLWFDTPSVKCVQGKWVIDLPDEMQEHDGEDDSAFDTLADVFDIESREKSGAHKVYEQHIERTLKHHLDQGRKFGSVLLEPVVLGAGGMILADPLFQRALVNIVRRSPSLFGTETGAITLDEHNWSGLPIIFDEVFTGLYRLGRFSASSFLNIYPDISVHAKLLTGGLVPLCTTLASESIFRIFESDDKTDALLHGHSYTAHPVGCSVAVESLRQMQAIETNGTWDWAKQGGWSQVSVDRSTANPEIWSMWSRSFVDWLSHRPSIAGAWALGNVLAIHLNAPSGAGYTSTAAIHLRDALRKNVNGNSGRPWNIHSRVLGNVLYVMSSQQTDQTVVQELERVLRNSLSS
ncbi:hypothetical protein SUNI508_07987 [Seiridium unicorne]|uniref:Dethiobiotin synthase n=1 Tax=Seiridium unicorne TaxID=138068 RepID=A0ABR2UVX7_9PEZI